MTDNRNTQTAAGGSSHDFEFVVSEAIPAGTLFLVPKLRRHPSESDDGWTARLSAASVCVHGLKSPRGIR
jgi:hypothetical protein